jgi:hypothetical protein
LEHRHRDGIKRVSKATRYVVRGAEAAGNLVGKVPSYPGNLVTSSLLSFDYNVDNKARLNMTGIDPDDMFSTHIVVDTHQRAAMEELLRGAVSSNGQQNITGDLIGIVLGDRRTVWVCDQCHDRLERHDPIGEDYLTLPRYIPLVKKEPKVEVTLCNSTAVMVFKDTFSRLSKTDRMIIRIDPSYFEAPERSTGARFNSIINLFNDLCQVLQAQKALKHLEIHANATTDGRVFAGFKTILKCRSLETLLVSGIPCFLKDNDLLIMCRNIKELTLRGILVDAEQAADNLRTLIGMNPGMTKLMVTQAGFTSTALIRLFWERRQELLFARVESMNPSSSDPRDQEVGASLNAGSVIPLADSQIPDDLVLTGYSRVVNGGGGMIERIRARSRVRR